MIRLFSVQGILLNICGFIFLRINSESELAREQLNNNDTVLLGLIYLISLTI
jgi:hypothetical protein